MFATLLGPLPRPDGALDDDAAVVAAIRAQEAAGLEPLTDGQLRDRALGISMPRIAAKADTAPIIAAWEFAASRTDRAVKHALPGPFTGGWEAVRHGGNRANAVRSYAASLNAVVRRLAAAGCPLVEIHEYEAHRIGADEAERALFREAHAIATDGITGTHLSLAIIGSAGDAAGIETILAAPYASLAVDLIAGPDNWNLVTRTPKDRGIIVGALSARTPEEPKEILLWGAHYAASTAGRGIDRVGIGSAGAWTSLGWDEAVRRMHALGEAARLAGMPPSEELRRSLDPKAVSARRAGLGHQAPPKPGGR